MLCDVNNLCICALLVNIINRKKICLLERGRGTRDMEIKDLSLITGNKGFEHVRGNKILST